jgi:cell division protein FtsI (penicillin-binding protein 3)
MGLWGTVIGARLFFLQVVESADFRNRASGQQQKTIDIMPPRGVIYDRNKNELAASIKVKSVFASPKEIPARERAATAKTLAAITGLSAADITLKLNTDSDFVWIKRKVSNAEAAAIDKGMLTGIHFEEESQRFYPNGELAAQVLGYVGVDE